MSKLIRKLSKVMKKIISLFVIIIFTITSVKASHLPGGNITYECVGPDQYLVTLTMYEDCQTGFMTPGSSFTINVVNSCGLPTQVVSATEIVFGNEVSQLCPTAQSTCNGGTLPGVQEHQYQVLVTLPGPCDSWTFYHTSCCRNGSVNATSTVDDYYFYATLNNLDAPCNNSPTYTGPPIPYVCSGQTVCFSLGVVEVDGNTLVYSFTDALENPMLTPVVYSAGYSGASPIPGITIDPVTGQVNFIAPGLTGQYLVVILIEEYDANGVLIGSQVYDFVFNVVACNNQVVDCATSGTIGNVNGSVFQTGPTSLQMCEGVPFTFDMLFTDPDVGDSLFMDSNIDLILPGSVVSYSYPNSPNGNEISMTVSWTPPPGSASSNNSFTVTIFDNACPVSGQQTIVYNMDVVGSTNASGDVIICLGQETQLEVFNGTVFDWTVVSGDPLNVGTNFSCTPCSNPVASPTITTVYEVVSDLTGSCVNRDTVTVTVVPDFTYSLTQSSTTTCLNSDIQFSLIPNPAGAYSYQWDPGAFLNNTTIASPTVTPTTPGNYEYSVEITSPNGCVKNDTIDINVAASYSPDVTVNADVNNIICGDTVNFTTDLGGGIPAVCGPSPNTVCSSASSQQTIGTLSGTGTTTSWPAPYGNWYRNAKHQFLYTAAELNAMGFIGGKITEIAWEITTINGTTAYNSYQISMGCTGTTSLTAWETGLIQVMSPQNIVINTGWNVHALTTAYEWDGISNLVVEICYDNLAVSYTQNSSTPYTTTGFNSCLYYRSDSQPACPELSSTTSANRPITRFTTCPTIPDPANFSFAWTPVSEIDDATAQNTFGVPLVTTNYQLVVTDLNGGCTDTVEVLIDVLCDTCYAPNPTLTHITCNGGIGGEIIAVPNGLYGPWTIEFTDVSTGLIIQTDNMVTTNAAITGLSAGDYNIRSIDTEGCYADTVVTILEPPIVDLTVSNDTIVCVGGNGVLQANATNGNGAPYDYNWSQGIVSTAGTQNVNPTISTIYDVYSVDMLGCSSDTLSVTVSLFPPILTTANPDIVVCPGDLGSIGVQANGGIGGTYFYEWADAQGNVVGNGSDINVLSTSSPQVFYVTVTDNCETPATIDEVEVTWYSEPVVLFEADTVDGCYPVNATFNNTTNPSMVSSCFWNFGDGNTSSICGTVSNTYVIPGSYTVDLIVTSPDGCVSNTTTTNMITVYDYPTSYFLSDPNPTDVLNPTVNFTDSSSSDVVSWYWSFGENGELGNSTETDPSLIFPDAEPGTYPVELITSNVNGCLDTSMFYVVVNGVYNFYVPSAFTPDGDGINDYFFPLGESVSEEGYELRIFNRWGDVVFFSEEMSVKWDGTYQSGPAELGVYVWIVKTVDGITGEFREYTGHVSLIR